MMKHPTTPTRLLLLRQLLQATTRQKQAPAAGLALPQRRHFTAEQTAANTRRLAQKLCYAPPSIGTIPSAASDEIGDAGAAIRPIGSSRRVFLMNAYLTPNEIEGLAYRIRALTNNQYINSVLIATDDDDPRETGCMPAMLLDVDEYRAMEDYDSHYFDPKPGRVWHAAGGYDPLEWFKSDKYKDTSAVASLLDSVQDLALATRGDHWKSRVPVITIPHGAVTDSGYAFCLSSYMIATEQTHFHIRNPSRGLTFDPVGFSFILPRLGKEFDQPAAKYKGCGYIMALMGYQATPDDMVETGLATHYMENPTVVMGPLERTLSQSPPWEHQRIVRSPKLTEGERTRLTYETPEEYNKRDHHGFSRNVWVADAVYTFADHSARTRDMDYMESKMMENDRPDAMYDMDPTPFIIERDSDLVDFAYGFDHIFRRETTVQGLLESFHEVAAKENLDDPEEQEVAADFVRRLEAQSPLALRVTHKLMKLGEGSRETLASCMAREKAAQARMMTKPDFESWGEAQLSISASKATPTWQHASIAEVTEDEVSEIIGV